MANTARALLFWRQGPGACPLLQPPGSLDYRTEQSHLASLKKKYGVIKVFLIINFVYC